MIKRPSLRVPRISDVAPEVLDELHADLETVADLLPFPVVDIETAGSAARGAWSFHSDLDLNFATGTHLAWRNALRTWRENPEGKSQAAMRRCRELTMKWGVRFEMSFQSPAIKDDPKKACWSWRERKMYHPDKTEVIQRYFFSYIDEDGNMVFNKDPYSDEENAKWAKRYGPKFQRIGFTKDTEWIRKLNDPEDIRPL